MKDSISWLSIWNTVEIFNRKHFKLFTFLMNFLEYIIILESFLENLILDIFIRFSRKNVICPLLS